MTESRWLKWTAPRHPRAQSAHVVFAHSYTAASWSNHAIVVAASVDYQYLPVRHLSRLVHHCHVQTAIDAVIRDSSTNFANSKARLRMYSVVFLSRPRTPRTAARAKKGTPMACRRVYVVLLDQSHWPNGGWLNTEWSF